MRALVTTRTRRGDDAGAILIMVAMLLTVVTGFAALAVDTAKLRQERRELQNGAAAAALAVAKDCAAGNCLTPAATANVYADLNAADGAANIGAVCGSGVGLVAYPASDPTPRARRLPNRRSQSLQIRGTP